MMGIVATQRLATKNIFPENPQLTLWLKLDSHRPRPNWSAVERSVYM